MNPFLLTEDTLQEPWRLLTCHGVHWDWSHAIRNGLALAVPFLLEHRRRHLAFVLLLLAPLLSLALLPVLDGGAYGGLSGVASSAWAYVGIRLWASGERRLPGIALLGLLVAKLTLEGLAGAPLPWWAGGTWVSLPEAHVWGTFLGLTVGMLEAAGEALSAARLPVEG